MPYGVKEIRFFEKIGFLALSQNISIRLRINSESQSSSHYRKIVGLKLIA
jgi:hypothetical protein